MTQELLLNPLHRQAGATLGPWKDWVVPLRFSNPDEEHRAVRQRWGLIDWSVTGLVEVRGADRIAFLHNLLTNDINALRPGMGCHACLVSPTAKLLADVLVLANADSHWMLVNRSRADLVLKTLNQYLITEDVRLDDQTGQYAIFALQGPASPSLLQPLLGVRPPPVQSLAHQVDTVEGTPIHLVAHSLTGEPGVLLLVVAEQAAWLWDFLLQRGRAHGLVPVGWEALNVLRLEAGIPWYGVDMDDTNLLPETGLEAYAVSYTKGCYVGQEVMARLQTYGSVSRKLMGLVCSGPEVPTSQDRLLKDDELVGQITSACWSPTLKQPIALGYVKRPCYEAGVGVTVKHATQDISARVVNRPLTGSR